MLGACNHSQGDEVRKLAEDMGSRHASMLSDTIPGLSDQDIQTVLMQVRAKEWQMRHHGLSHAADAYIRAFQDSLSVTNASLARSIF